MIKAYAANAANTELSLIEYDPGPLAEGQIDIDVIACGVCHSDLSMLNNDWGLSQYPLVPGHEVVGRVASCADGVEHLQEGDLVGLGWYSHSCMVCSQCMGGDHNLCGQAEQTIVGRHGGFADKVRCHAEWAVKLPSGLPVEKVGPLFCGGLTVFNPIVQFNVQPTDRVGVIGIGGLGHLALQFFNAWGCEVTAFSSNAAKADQIKAMGAHHIVNSREPEEIQAIAGSLDFILSTVNVDLDWSAYISALGPRGRLHSVGAVPNPIPVEAFALIGGQKSVSGSPLGSPATAAKMLEFCARHDILPVTETFPMSEVNQALAHLQAGKARYRVVLLNDFE